MISTIRSGLKTGTIRYLYIYRIICFFLFRKLNPGNSNIPSLGYIYIYLSIFNEDAVIVFDSPLHIFLHAEQILSIIFFIFSFSTIYLHVRRPNIVDCLFFIRNINPSNINASSLRYICMINSDDFYIYLFLTRMRSFVNVF